VWWFSLFWSMRSFIGGTFSTESQCLLVAILGTFCFWQCVARRRRFVAWLIMLGMFASFLALHSLLPQTEGFHEHTTILRIKGTRGGRPTQY
jgi:hypothetical protein